MSDRPVPSPRQLAFQDLELGMFCHFGPNTFADQEWGEGDDDPAIVDPSDLDPSQWAETAADAGMKYLVVTTKHHDGFCMWPTDTTDYSIASSPCDADMVELVAQACRDHGLKLGLYCSPWDRHEPCYDDSPAYDRHFAAQWTELLTRYGEVSYVWLDGAGSAGHVYDWEMIIGTIREHAPETCIFSMGEPDVRWVGNEDGLAPDPCWDVVEEPEGTNATEWLLPDFRASFPHWIPAECDARIRANWFWHDHDLPSLKSLERLVHMYYNSVGRGCNLLLNVGPAPAVRHAARRSHRSGRATDRDIRRPDAGQSRDRLRGHCSGRTRAAVPHHGAGQGPMGRRARGHGDRAQEHRPIPDGDRRRHLRPCRPDRRRRAAQVTGCVLLLAAIRRPSPYRPISASDASNS